MLKRRIKRLVSVAASLCTIALFVVKLRHGQPEQKQWGMVSSRSINSHDSGITQLQQKALGFYPVSSRKDAIDGDKSGPRSPDTTQDHITAHDEGSDNLPHTKRDDEDGEDDYDGDLDDDDAAYAVAGTTEGTVPGTAADLPVDALLEGDDDQYSPLPEAKDYREVFSLTSNNRKFYSIYLGGDIVYNPSIIPHPTRHDLWIIVAQHEQSSKESHDEEALTCTAGFYNGALVCTAPPMVLPVTKSIEGKCEGEIAYFNLRGGPRDARTFYGPEAPYIVYGSQTSYTCMSIWLQDLRMLLQDFRLEQMTLVKLFKKAFEIQRPPPFKAIEKNFFLFWDSDNKAYVHHDIYPSRTFAQISYDGSVGSDLGLATATKDGICMAKYMPTIESGQETIHQATNSLSITFCRRSDPFCVPDDINTFIMTIFQHKSYYEYHSIYEPYVMLFQRSAPFAIHAISQRPIWIHGRNQLTADTHAIVYDQHPERAIPEGHSEMFYITSMSWKTHGQRYHGYIDDPLFLAFGIEDSRPALMDVMAGDLLQDLGFCSR